VLVAWERVNGGGFQGQGRVRDPSSGWGPLQPISGQHANQTQPTASADALGDLATASAVQGTVTSAVVAAFDAAPPSVSDIAVSGSPLAGGALTFAATAADAWSPISAMPWSFGDGGTGAGSSVAHAFANAGAYTTTVTVADAAGNVASKTLGVSIAALQSTMTQASFSAKWTASRVKGSLVVKGTIARAGTYAITASLGGKVKLRASAALPAGAFSKTLKLPAKMTPGTYRVELDPPFAANQVKGVSRDAKLTAPPEGVVDKVTMSGANGGPAARTLRGVRKVWATFHFVARPKTGKLTLTWYRTPAKGKRKKIGDTQKPVSTKVTSFIGSAGLKGTLTAVLTSKGKVVAQGSVKVL
jgi:hypothetical protein